ncbi:MAG TPA: cyclic nucleotide-binding domain-containing protein [Opitutaceae bacterium]|nr:cyclic nucleotide-binding domain-containing protein [Opitutaceae bacterium]
MNAPLRAATVPLKRRTQLVQQIPGFSGLPASMMSELAHGLKEEHFPAGDVVVAEGQIGDRLFLIEQGRAEVSTSGATGMLVLAVLGRDDMFGEIALLASNHRRQATVTAVTPLLTLSLSADSFEKALTACPEARIDVAAVADTLLTAKFLKQQGSWRR